MPSDGDSRTAYAALGAAGWIGVHWPEHLGGRGLTPLHTVACEESFGYHWLPLSGYLLSVKTIGNALSRFASPEIQERLLPEVAAGRLVFCQGFSEPDAGSDLASLRTTAVDRGDRFVVSGRKLWTSSADYADWIYLAVRTGTQPRHRGLSVLVAPIDTPGITVSAHETLGGGTIGEVELEDVEIPRDMLVGTLDGGWSVLMGTLDHERVTSEKVGVVLWLLDQLDGLAETRGRPRAAAPAARRGAGGAPARAARGGPARPGTPRVGAELDGEAGGGAPDAAHRGRGGRARRPGRADRVGHDDAAGPDRRVPPRGGGDDDLRRRGRGPAHRDRAPGARVPGVAPLPLDGVRVLEHAQYVAGPFAGMLLADLGADVVKVEPPSGDAWRHYEPFDTGQSRCFYALNRNKRSVVIDLKTAAGRQANAGLIGTADAVIHNLPADRAARYGLDRESVRAANPRAVWCSVSALGSDGPDAGVTAFDLVAQALSGLLLADPRPGDPVPRRAGGIAMADFTAGLLSAISVLAGLAGRTADREADAAGVEVSLLGAALAVQAQRFVSIPEVDAGRTAPAGLATAGDLAERALDVTRGRRARAVLPRYRASDGFFVLTCLSEAQRRTTLQLLELEDRFVANPQARPATLAERVERRQLVTRFEERLAQAPAADWIARFRAAGVPAGEVRALGQLFDDPQVQANGLVQEVAAPGAPVRLLGGLFKVDGVPVTARRGVPALGEHTHEVLGTTAGALA